MAASLVLGACAFEPGEIADDEGFGGKPSGPGTGTDTGTGTGSGTTTQALPCTFAETDLRLCLEFDDAKLTPIVTDASTARLDGTATALSTASRNGSPAAGFGWDSKITIPESPMLDITGALTLELWVWPEYPHSANLLLNANQYRIQLSGDGRIGCAFGNSQVWSSSYQDVRAWTHVACTFSDNALTVYINGNASGTATSIGAPTTGTSGTQLGSFAGDLDDVHIYARALTAAQVCAHAGRTSCNSGTQLDGD